jgi:PPOX class probable F420-dependent enzyme
MTVHLSDEVLALLREPSYAQLATLMPDGSPQVTQVWIDIEGEHIIVNTAVGHQKERNVRRDPRVAINLVDPNDQARQAAIRGQVVEMSTEGAADQINALAKKYMGVDEYPFGSPDETRITLKIAPEHVSELQGSES